MNILKTLGNNIRERRINLDISQEKLAEIADLHRTYIGAVQREKILYIYTKFSEIQKSQNLI